MAEPGSRPDLRPARPPAAARWTDLLLLVAINFMWALKWTLSKAALREIEPVSITLFPMMGTLLLLVPLMRQRLKGQPAYLGIIRREALLPANLFRFLLLGAAGQAATQVFTGWGLKYMPATDAAFISLGAPILNAVLAVVMLGEAFSWRLLPGFTLAVAGVLLMTGVDLRSGQVSNWWYLLGALLILAAKLGGAFYNAYSKKLLGVFRPAEILFYSYIAVVVCLYPLHLFLEQPLSLHRIAGLHWQTWCSLALLSVLVYGLSMVLFLEVLTRRSLAPVSVSIYLMTVFGALISTTTLGEPVTSNMILGALLVLFSSIFANSGKAAVSQGAEPTDPARQPGTR